MIKIYTKRSYNERIFLIGSCPTASLFAFIQNSSIASTMTIAGGYYLPNDGTNNSNALSGAFVSMKCNDGYVQAGGQLNITCVGDTWTTFPTCVSRSGSSSPCVVDKTTTYNITNGYPTVISLSYISDTTATGN